MSDNMNFTEFEKMQNSLSKINLEPEFKKVDWLVTEKIHGANFSFHCDGENVILARRRAFLQKNENFFNCQTADFLEPTKVKVKELFKIIKENFKDVEISHISVYGELFGGSYKIEGAPDETQMKPIQIEIQYCPHIDWLAYDIAYTQTDNPLKHEYLDAEYAMELFKKTNIEYVRPLFIGKMNKALTYQLGFDSTIPAYFNLPPLPKGSNKAEGVVVKPMKNMKMINKHQEEERAIVKIKLPEFDEMRNQPKKKSTASTGEGKKKGKPQNLIGRLTPYVTEQRLQSAITKVGDLASDGNQEKVKTECFEDIFRDIKEYDEDLHTQWETSTDQEKKKNNEILMKKIEKLIFRFQNEQGF